MSPVGAETAGQAHRELPQALVAYTAFCGLGLLSYRVPWALNLMVLSGLAIPLAWGLATRDWARMGFSRQRVGPGLAWGLGAGLATSAIGLACVGERAVPTDLGLELAVGVPLWLLVASPFQEFFFRGWLQPRFERSLGKGWGLLVTTAGFVAWHYCWPLASASGFPLNTPAGLAAIFFVGLIYGYSFQRAGHILAPWLGHALAGFMFLYIGAGSFLDALV
jgi:membrane protease YdiL (CAAX protease family)